MRKRTAAQAFLAALVLAIGYLVVQPSFTAQAATPVRIMPLGDSITGSPGCWRALLWNKLINAGYTNIDFVGTLPAQGCGVSYDGDNEGHGGHLATNIANQNLLPGWLSATRPDIVIMHLGTNDVWSNLPASQILAAFTTMVGQMRASNPAMKVVVAKIIPVAPSTCAECPARTVLLNDAIPAWAASLTTAQSPITVVDQWTGWVPSTDTYDGVHPSDPAGITKMSEKWYPAVVSALSGVTPTSAPVTTRAVTSAPVTTRAVTSAPVTSRAVTSAPVTSRAVTSAPVTSRAVTSAPVTSRATSAPPSNAGPCTATYTVVGQWQGGFQGEVTVKAGPTAISRWTTTWTYANGQTVTQSWSSTLTSSGPTVTASNAAWNGTLAANATTAFGFIGSWTGTNSVPTVTCTAS